MYFLSVILLIESTFKKVPITHTRARHEKLFKLFHVPRKSRSRFTKMTPLGLPLFHLISRDSFKTSEVPVGQDL